MSSRPAVLVTRTENETGILTMTDGEELPAAPHCRKGHELAEGVSEAHLAHCPRRRSSGAHTSVGPSSRRAGAGPFTYKAAVAGAPGPQFQQRVVFYETSFSFKNVIVSRSDSSFFS